MPEDLHPQKLYLSAHSVMSLLDMDRHTFRRFLKENPAFPSAFSLGQGVKRLRYSKAQVYAWIEMNVKN